MSVNEKDFYDVALENYDFGTEIGYRMCLGRSYYAMYHSALKIIHKELPNYKTGGKHYSLITHLADPHNSEPHDSKHMKIISYMLRQGRELRNKADYDVNIDISDLIAEEQLAQVNRMMGICGSLTPKAA